MLLVIYPLPASLETIQSLSKNVIYSQCLPFYLLLHPRVSQGFIRVCREGDSSIVSEQANL